MYVDDFHCASFHTLSSTFTIDTEHFKLISKHRNKVSIVSGRPLRMDTLMVRRARAGDLETITEIYANEVSNGTASFEIIPPSVAEMTRRWRSLTEVGYPYYVATLEVVGVVGYAYAGAYRPRPAYEYTFETSVYVAHHARRRGVGRALLSTLTVACQDIGAKQLIAVIGDSAHTASIELHRSAGYALVGTLRNVGYKNARWLDSVLMQRSFPIDDKDPPVPVKLSR